MPQQLCTKARPPPARDALRIVDAKGRLVDNNPAMSFPPWAHEIFWGLPALVMVLISGTLIIQLLAEEDHGDVRALWYVFFLAATIATLCGLWVSDSKGVAVDNITGKESPVDVSAEVVWLWRAFKFVGDYEGELKFLLLIAILVLIPQILSYLICALIGCASKIFFLGGTMSFVFWNLMKFIVVAASVQLVTGIFRFTIHPNGTELINDLFASAVGLFSAFFFVSLYRIAIRKQMFTLDSFLDFVIYSIPTFVIPKLVIEIVEIILKLPWEKWFHIKLKELIQHAIRKAKIFSRRNIITSSHNNRKLQIVAGVVFSYSHESPSAGLEEIVEKLSIDKMISEVEPFIVRVNRPAPPADQAPEATSSQ